MATRYTLREVTSASSTDIPGVQSLCYEYAAELRDVSGLDLLTASFQTFAAEVESLPGVYSPLSGGLLIVAVEPGSDTPVGVAAYKILSPGLAEMKRLFVAPSARRTGLGRTLAETVMAAAASAGCVRMNLDTLECLKPALALYENILGFQRIPPYVANTRHDAVFLGIDLTSSSSSLPAALPVAMGTPGSDVNVGRVFLPRIAAAAPERTALRFPVSPGLPWPDSHHSFSYGWLDAASTLGALNLHHEIGMGPDDSVLILVRPSLQLFVFVLSVLKTGASIVVVDPRLGIAHSLAWISRLSPTVVVAPLFLYSLIGLTKCFLFRGLRAGLYTGSLCGKSITRYIPGLSSLLSSVEDLVPGPDDDVSSDVLKSHPAWEWYGSCVSHPDDSAFVVFTSGSTGPAKPVLLTHGMIYAQRAALKAMFEVRPGDSTLEHNFAFVLLDLVLGLETTLLDMNYASKLFVAEYDPANLAAIAEDVRPTHIFASYVLMANLVRYYQNTGATFPDSVRAALTFGAPIPLDLHRRFMDVLPPSAEPDTVLYAPYGATECIPIASVPGGSATLLTPSIMDRTASGLGIPVGVPAQGLQVCILSGPPARALESFSREADVVMVHDGSVWGEILVSGSGVSPEYMNDPESTAANKVVDEEGTLWHRTGDLGWMDDEDGMVWYGGRISHALVIPHYSSEQDGGTDTEIRVPAVCIESIVNGLDPVFRSAAVLGPASRIWIVIEPEHSVSDDDDALSSLGESVVKALAPSVWPSELFDASRVVVWHTPLPVDRRHNSKIDRPAIGRWLAGL